ncbi:MAG TPA: hypothetical protein VJK00_06445, partial [Steroidobacteraceae bacterium]|nr:hypothetical protein [Steroidobacteraceae bacterium]
LETHVLQSKAGRRVRCRTYRGVLTARHNPDEYLLSTPPMPARKELIVFMLVAAAALGSILSFALTSHRREAQTTPGTLVQAAVVGGVCPNEIKVQRGRDTPPTICAAVCAPSPGAPAQCDCTINRDSCRAVGTSASR